MTADESDHLDAEQLARLTGVAGAVLPTAAPGSARAGPLTRASLLVRLRDASDPAAWEQAWAQFVELYTPLVFAYCTHRGLQDADAADVAQDVMRAVSGAIGDFRYDPKRGRFRAWLLTITRSKLVDHLNRSARQPLSGGSDVREVIAAQPDPREQEFWRRLAEQSACEWALRRARDEVEAQTWEMFRRVVLDNEPAADVAAAMSRNLGAVYVAKSRVLARVRQILVEAEMDC